MPAIGPAGERPEPEVTSPPPAGPESDSTTPDDAPDAAPAAGGWVGPATGSGQPSAPGRRPKAIVIGAIGLIVALAVTIGAKVLPFLAAGVLGSALAGAFGGPWERLPADVQSDYERRIVAAVGNRLDGLEDAERVSRIEALVKGGLPRLSDDRLVERLGFQTTALNNANESICAAFGRQSLAGTAVDSDTATALFASLETEDIVDLVGIAVEAVEAETSGFPEPVLADEAEASVLIESVLVSMTEAEVQTIADVSQGGTATDAEVCGAIRSLYDSAATLDPASQVLMARIDIQAQP